MKWLEHGLVYNPVEKLDWADSHALQPTPLLMEDRIRVFAGFRQSSGISRVGYVDLDPILPTRVIGYSMEPVLDIGEDGCFDENGVVPTAVLAVKGRVYLFFAGYQLGSKVRFTVFGGLAVSDDGGNTFKRAQRVPVFERTDEETLFRVPHSVFYENGVWKAWYGGGSRFIQGANKTLPIYNIRYTESSSPYLFDKKGVVVLSTSTDEYRLGRPYMFKRGPNDYRLFYGYSTQEAPYKLGYAVSENGEDWVRQDHLMGLDIAASGWNSEMNAYPSVISSHDRVWMFYNGRNYGEDGFGVAELLAW